MGITPYTGGKGQVLVDLDTEVSTLTALDPITRLPDKNTRTANTTVRVNDGQTIVIGGLVEQETRGVQTKVPVLGDIPIIGQIFKTKDIRTTQSELILFITPRVLSGTGHLPEAEEKRIQSQFRDGSPEPMMQPDPSTIPLGLPRADEHLPDVSPALSGPQTTGEGTSAVAPTNPAMRPEDSAIPAQPSTP